MPRVVPQGKEMSIPFSEEMERIRTRIKPTHTLEIRLT